MIDPNATNHPGFSLQYCSEKLGGLVVFSCRSLSGCVRGGGGSGGRRGGEAVTEDGRAEAAEAATSGRSGEGEHVCGWVRVTTFPREEPWTPWTLHRTIINNRLNSVRIMKIGI